MLRPVLLLLLATLPLGAAGPDLNLDLHTMLGQDPALRIRLVPPGAWQGLIQTGLAPVRQSPHARKVPGATVEILDFLPPGSERSEAFARFRLDLHQRLEIAFQNPPASNGEIDLGIFMATDPAHPEQMNENMVRSLQDRFNAMPPGSLPVPVR